MSFVLALAATTAAGAAPVAADATRRDAMIGAARASARAGVTILQPATIDIDAAARGEGDRARTTIRRDARGTLWVEFS